MVTWGPTLMGVDVETAFPEIRDMNDERAYAYMDLNQVQKGLNIELGYIYRILCQCQTQPVAAGCPFRRREENCP